MPGERFVTFIYTEAQGNFTDAGQMAASLSRSLFTGASAEITPVGLVY